MHAHQVDGDGQEEFPHGEEQELPFFVAAGHCHDGADAACDKGDAGQDQVGEPVLYRDPGANGAYAETDADDRVVCQDVRYKANAAIG